MKKKYIQPACLVREIGTHHILAGSGGYEDVPTGGTTTEFGAKGDLLDLDLIDTEGNNGFTSEGNNGVSTEY